jgi:hypothetical protein
MGRACYRGRGAGIGECRSPPRPASIPRTLPIVVLAEVHTPVLARCYAPLTFAEIRLFAFAT